MHMELQTARETASIPRQPTNPGAPLLSCSGVPAGRAVLLHQSAVGSSFPLPTFWRRHLKDLPRQITPPVLPQHSHVVTSSEKSQPARHRPLRLADFMHATSPTKRAPAKSLESDHQLSCNVRSRPVEFARRYLACAPTNMVSS
jgi:hypothetical protein